MKGFSSQLGPIAIMLLLASLCSAQTSADLAIGATAHPDPAGIDLRWQSYTDSVTAGTRIYRRSMQPGASWTLLDSVGHPATSFLDSTAAAGTRYEYRIQRVLLPGAPNTAIAGNGYLVAGKEMPALHERGGMLLLVDSVMAGPLDSLIQVLRWDLRADGYHTYRMDIPRSEATASVRARIQQLYASDTSLEGVYIIGHVPVPYSGNTAPDGHNGNHSGAWPADPYYGELDGNWTDLSVTDTSSARPANHNVPGDGKFDQFTLLYYSGQVLSEADLFVGRADFHNLPAFTQSDTALLANYLRKAHRWKHREYTAPRRALVEDNFGYFSGEAFAASGYRNFQASVGPDSTFTLDFTSQLDSTPYLWAYGTGAGTYTSAGGIVNTNRLASDTMKAVFSMLFGSYFGDWDSQNNLMRSMVAQGDWTLTCGWAGRPHWYLHHMAAGFPIGHAFRVTLNNPPGPGAQYTPVNFGGSGVYMGLMGDPSLRTSYFFDLSTVAADTAEAVTVQDSIRKPRVRLWWPLLAVQHEGFHVYRATHPDSGYTRLTTQPLSAVTDTFIDPDPVPGAMNHYMVRVMALDSSASGTYYNLGLGALDSVRANELDTLPMDTTDRGLAKGSALGIELYPNPASTSVELRLREGTLAAQTIELRSVAGRLIRRYETAGGRGELRLSLPEVPSGVYVLSGEGWDRRLVIER